LNRTPRSRGPIGRAIPVTNPDERAKEPERLVKQKQPREGGRFVKKGATDAAS
jgi:hypothetical protein